MSNQHNDDQREALFNAVVAYVSNTENLPALLPAVEKVVQKHISLQVKPEQYSIVGKHLLATLDEMFDPGQEMLGAQSEIYGVLADVSINREAEICNENAGKTDGWEGIHGFHIIAETPRSTLITSFELKPVDGSTVIEYRPGQYLGVQLELGDFSHQEIRRYSLTHKPDDKGCHIMVKREEGGQIPNWLHSHANIGDVVKLIVPAGSFFITVADDTPVTLISAGVGQAPMLAALDALAKVDHTIQVNWFHAAENGGVHALVDEVKELGLSLSRLTAHTWHCQPDRVDHAKNQLDNEGLMDLSKSESAFSDLTMQFYLCDLVDFMQLAAKQLVDLDVKQESIHHERFGPHKVL